MLASAVAWAVSHLTGETAITPAQVLSGAAADGGGMAARWARWLVVDHDPVASFAFLLLSLLVTLLAPAATAGAIARDVGNRGFRFLLIRTGRDEVFWGRFLATAGLAMAMVALTGLLAGVGVAAARGGGLGEILWWLWAATALALTALPYLALGILASTVVGHPFGSLAVAKGAVVVVIGLATALAALWAPLIHVIHLLPIAPQLYLFHPDPGIAAAAAAGCVAYAALYLALARAHFLRRDL
jgi:ABC-type transport system involved in multi-copper enzyme maturation permease subunit